MRNETEETVDLWRQVASAVEYIAAVERPGFTVWDAVLEALEFWTSDDDCDSMPHAWRDLDPLRSCFEHLLAVTPPAGSAGGAPLAETFLGALAHWLAVTAGERNQGQPFR